MRGSEKVGELINIRCSFGKLFIGGNTDLTNELTGEELCFGSISINLNYNFILCQALLTQRRSRDYLH